MNELLRCYLDNELWHCDSQAQQFIHPDDSKSILSFALVENVGVHVANLKIVTIKGYPYYHDERLKEFRRVGRPTCILSYDQFDLIPEKDRTLTIPRGEEFRRVMAKEKGYWERRQKDAERGCG